VDITTGISETLRDQPKHLTGNLEPVREDFLEVDLAHRGVQREHPPRLINEAGCTSVVVIRTSTSRSASVNDTGRFFCEGMTNSLAGAGEGSASTVLPAVAPQTSVATRD